MNDEVGDHWCMFYIWTQYILVECLPCILKPSITQKCCDVNSLNSILRKCSSPTRIYYNSCCGCANEQGCCLSLAYVVNQTQYILVECLPCLLKLSITQYVCDISSLNCALRKCSSPTRIYYNSCCGCANEQGCCWSLVYVVNQVNQDSIRIGWMSSMFTEAHHYPEIVFLQQHKLCSEEVFFVKCDLLQ